MVDALLSAAAESDSALADIIAGRNEDMFIIRHDERHSQTPQRFCEFCHSSNTPTWRRGPAGKGSLCNACGIKWRLRKRLKKNEKGSPSSPPTTPDKRASPSSSSITKPHKKRKERERDSSPKASRQLQVKDKDPSMIVEYSVKENKRKKYYCKYCDQTFSLSQFRNSQQFGAHCSNCSRRPGRFGEDGVSSLYDMDAHRDYGYGRYSPYDDSPSSHETERSSPESPSLGPLPQPNNRNGLLMRLLYVVEHQLVDVHELADIKDELSTLKDELISREEARKEELTTMHAKVKEDLADIKTNFQNSVAAHEQLAATRLMEMEQTIKMRGAGTL